MTKTLVIVESPAKAKTISKFLGRKYFVKASMGHVRDLPKSQFGVDIKNGFNPKYITIRGRGDTIKELRTAAKKADKVLIASDPDREGEAIAWHLQDLLGIPENEPCRIEFNEITQQAIQKALRQPRPIDFCRVNAQQARRILDRLVGYNLSPLLWRKVKKGLSAGRVQSVAVRLICEREQEIKSFVAEEYWTITGTFQKEGKPQFEGKLHRLKNKSINIHNEKKVLAVINELGTSSYVVNKVINREKHRKPAPPFITSTLQQEAYRRLNFTARKTMQIAQQLYEGLDLGEMGTTGLITYIRTDSTRISNSAREEAVKYIEKRFGPAFIGKETARLSGRARVADAHEAIRPTLIDVEPERLKGYLSRDQYRLYSVIWSRFLASQMSQAVYDTTTVDISAGDYQFRAAGSVLKFAGFMKVYTESSDQEDHNKRDGSLPELMAGDSLKVISLEPKQHFTQPPPRYTDATLIKTLEEKGVGRPSTYAPTIETIIRRGYVNRDNKQLCPTELGVIVMEVLIKHFRDVIDIEFTAEMEDKLDSIEEGELDWAQVLLNFYNPFCETLEKADEEIGQIELADEITEEICPQCNKNMVIKMGRYGKFLACPGFPQCRYTRPILEQTGVKCPRCERDLVIRRSKKGKKFYGCSGYPECDLVTWDQPAKKYCPDCGDLMVEKKTNNKKLTLACINNKCKHVES